MADKEWDDMTLEEKCENLKESKDRLFEIASNLATEIRRMPLHFNSRINEIAKAVEKLEARMRALDGK